MGADGNVIIARRADFEAANPGVKPSDLSLYTGTVLGVEACWGYRGDNLFEPNYGREDDLTHRYVPDAPDGRHFVPCSEGEQEARTRALRWFNQNAETHEVWT